MARKTEIKKTSSEYYDGTPIQRTKARLKIIYSERSNGKSYWFMRYCVEEYVKHTRKTLYLRRWREFFKTRKNVDTLFDDLIANGEIERLTGGKWSKVARTGEMWYLAKVDETGNIERDTEPFMYGVSFAEAENIKSGFKDPRLLILLFDEFIPTAANYYMDEFALFTSIVSTAKRRKPDDQFEIIMLGNTMSPHGNPYFRNFGIQSPEKQELGTIQLYKVPIGDTGRDYLMAVERAPLATHKAKVLDDFFLAFDSPTARMTATGDWEISQYPLINDTYEVIRPANILFVFYVDYDGVKVQCDIVKDRKGVYCFCHDISHRKKLDFNRDVIYTDIHDIRGNIRLPFIRPQNNLDMKIKSLYDRKNFVYDSNATGDLIATFLKNVM